MSIYGLVIVMCKVSYLAYQHLLLIIQIFHKFKISFTHRSVAFRIVGCFSEINITSVKSNHASCVERIASRKEFSATAKFTVDSITVFTSFGFSIRVLSGKYITE